MNKRIQQLAEQASEIDGDDLLYYHPVFAEKFAQLIVEECAGIVDNYGRWIMYDKLAIKVKKHFGVE
jgi:hypothetical protein